MVVQDSLLLWFILAMFYLEAEQYFLNWEFLFNQLKVSFSFSPSLKRLQ